MPEHTVEARKNYWVLSEDRKSSQRLGILAVCAGWKTAFEAVFFKIPMGVSNGMRHPCFKQPNPVTYVCYWMPVSGIWYIQPILDVYLKMSWMRNKQEIQNEITMYKNIKYYHIHTIFYASWVSQGNVCYFYAHFKLSWKYYDMLFFFFFHFQNSHIFQLIS